MEQDTKKDFIEPSERPDNNAAGHAERIEVTSGPKKPALAWVAAALALAAWAALLFANGYVALGVGLVGAGIGIWGAISNEAALRRISVTAVIASIVLVVVLAAFLIVIKIGLS